MLKRSLKRQTSGRKSGPVSQTKRPNDDQNPVAALGESFYDTEERNLEKFVLGGDEEILEQLEHATSKSKKKKKDHPEEAHTAVWQDEDDDDIKVKISTKDFRHKYFKHKDKQDVTAKSYTNTLKSQFEKITGQPSWAKLKWQKEESDHEDSDEDPEAQQLLQSTGNYLSTSDVLPQGVIQLKPCTDANKEQPTKAKVRALEFHPTAQVILTGGSDQTLALFQVDGKTNPKIQSIFLDNFPVLAAHFSRDGTEVIMASKHKAFKYYDMIAGHVVNVPKIKGLEENRLNRFEMSPDGKYIVFLGEYGNMHLLSAKTKEWICTVKMNGSVEAIAFTPDGSKMFSHGDDGEVYVWDMRTRDCIHRFVDDGCIKGTAITVSKNGQYIATGSYSGVVNIYTNSCLTARKPNPLKIVKNLLTPCSSMIFNSTSEILAIASNYAERSVKMIHMSSLTAFSNFPEKTDPVRIPYCIDFSLNSGYFTIGSSSGQALLYRVKHYSNY